MIWLLLLGWVLWVLSVFGIAKTRKERDGFAKDAVNLARIANEALNLSDKICDELEMEREDSKWKQKMVDTLEQQAKYWASEVDRYVTRYGVLPLETKTHTVSADPAVCDEAHSDHTLPGESGMCRVCGKPATGAVNIMANAASSVPSVMEPRCEEHGMRLEYPGKPALPPYRGHDFNEPMNWTGDSIATEGLIQELEKRGYDVVLYDRSDDGYNNGDDEGKAGDQGN